MNEYRLEGVRWVDSTYIYSNIGLGLFLKVERQKFPSLIHVVGKIRTIKRNYNGYGIIRIYE